jgi:hypothetical protein
LDRVDDRHQLMLIALVRVEPVSDDHLRRRVHRRLRIVALDETVLGFHHAALGIGKVLLRFGIGFNRIVSSSELEAETFALARKIASRSPAAISTFKEAMRALSAAAPINPENYECLHGLRRQVYFGPDTARGCRVPRERPPKF